MKPTSMPATPTIDASAGINFELLTAPLTSDERRQYIKKTRPFVWIFAFGLVCLFLLPLYLTLSNSDPVMAVVLVIILLLVFISGIGALRKIDERRAKARRFAAVHGFTFNDDIRKPEGQEGSLFHIHTTTATVQDTLEGVFQGHPFWMGRYRYSIGSGRSRSDYDYVVLRATLSRRVPHVMLDSRRNKIHITPPFATGENMQLEGDFYKYYNVHVPRGYGADVLYFLTPELMLALKDLAKDFDIEFIEDKMYFYRVGKQSTMSPDDFRQFFQLLEGITVEARSNTRRYSDARAEQPGMIAEGGQRIALPRLDFRHPSTYLPFIFLAMGLVWYIIYLLRNN